MKHLLKLSVVLISVVSIIIYFSSCEKEPSPPTLTTASVSAITQTTATSGGNITSDGGAEILGKGVCWSTVQNPTIAHEKTSDGRGSGSFTSNLTGLTAGTQYYVRAYATNEAGTSYGNQQTFTTGDILLPTVTTTDASSITLTSAVSGGNVTDNGGGEVTAKGVCWSTSENPTTADDKTDDGTGTGSFTSDITGLTPGTDYYVRAYATNSAGTAYGNQVTFSTDQLELATVTTDAASSVTLTTAVTGGNVTDDGGAEVTAKGVCWSTTTGPTTSDNVTNDGTGTGAFASNLSSLVPGTTYYVRAYAINSVGTAYGNEITFDTDPVLLATVTTDAVSSVTLTTAVSGGDVTDDGGANVTAKGVCWSTTTGPTISDDLTDDGTGTGAFTSNLTDLTPGTTYYVRAYATNSAGTAYGNEVSFTTDEILLATLTTTAASSVTYTSAVSGGNITDDGGANVTARGVCWSTTANPTTSDDVTSNGTGTGSFTSNLTDLTPGTTYYVRAFATNSAGTAYGNQVSFTTDDYELATLTTTAASSVSYTSAVTGGNITDDGGANVTARGVCWSTTTGPTTSDNVTSNGTGTGSFTSNLTDLTPGTTYYVRAYATNTAGTAYGNQISFSTDEVELATLSTGAVYSISYTDGFSVADITDDGGADVTVRGHCWSTSINPTTADDHTVRGTGTGTFTSNLSGLNTNTTYYVRAYATNSAGTAYSNQVSFTTDQLIDEDGNAYTTVYIGTQLWMVENLYTTSYNTGDPIPEVTDNTAWGALVTGGYCWYDNDEATYSDPYGALYNWYAVNTGDLCPDGWHVPTDADWTALSDYLGGEAVAGGELKETGTTHWLATNVGATNSTGFTALPGGLRDDTGNFAYIGQYGNYASSTLFDSTHWITRQLSFANAELNSGNRNLANGYSIRCIKD